MWLKFVTQLDIFDAGIHRSANTFLKCSSTMLARALTVITIFIGALAVLYFLARYSHYVLLASIHTKVPIVPGCCMQIQANTIEILFNNGFSGNTWFRHSWTAANGASDLYFPSNLEQLKQVLAELAVIELHKVLPLFCVAYLFKQVCSLYLNWKLWKWKFTWPPSYV